MLHLGQIDDGSRSSSAFATSIYVTQDRGVRLCAVPAVMQACAPIFEKYCASRYGKGNVINPPVPEQNVSKEPLSASAWAQREGAPRLYRPQDHPPPAGALTGVWRRPENEGESNVHREMCGGHR